MALGLVNQLLEFKEGSEDMIEALTRAVTTKQLWRHVRIMDKVIGEA
jgi:hypothetical protein